MQMKPCTAAAHQTGGDTIMTIPCDRDNTGQYATLTLSGEWLQPLGFTIGQTADIRIEPGRIIIRLQPGA